MLNWVRILGLPVLVFCPLVAMAQEESADKDIPIFAIIDWYPLGWRNENGDPEGIGVDIVNYVVESLKIEAIIELSPIPRIQRKLQTNEIDFSIPAADPVSVNDLVFQGTIGCLSINLVPVKGSGIRSIEDIAGKRIGLPRGGYFDENYSNKYDFIHIEVVSNMQLFLLSERGRVDAIAINDAIWDGYRHSDDPEKQLPAEIWALFDEPIMHLPIVLFFGRPDNPRFDELARRIARFTFDAYHRGDFEKIYRKYGVRTGGNCPEGTFLGGPN